jgi:hypothetical protein
VIREDDYLDTLISLNVIGTSKTTAPRLREFAELRLGTPNVSVPAAVRTTSQSTFGDIPFPTHARPR